MTKSETLKKIQRLTAYMRCQGGRRMIMDDYLGNIYTILLRLQMDLAEDLCQNTDEGTKQPKERQWHSTRSTK